MATPPLWFAALFVKYSFVIRRILEPESTPDGEPLSKVGLAVLALASMLVAVAVSSTAG